MAKKSSKQEEKMLNEIRRLSKLDENKTCVDCPEKMPSYINSTHNTFVCTKCSGIHRELQFKVKGISMTVFTQDDVQAMQNGGNARHNAKYMARYSPRDMPIPSGSDVSKLREFIRAKYVEKRWYDDRGQAPEPSQNQVEEDRKHTNTVERRPSAVSSHAVAPVSKPHDSGSLLDFIDAPAPAPVVNNAPAQASSQFDAFGTPSKPSTGFDAFNSSASHPTPSSFDAFGAQPAASHATFDAFGGAAPPAPSHSTFNAFGGAAPPAPSHSTFDAFGAPASTQPNFNAFNSPAPTAAPNNHPNAFNAFSTSPVQQANAFGHTPVDPFGVSSAPQQTSTFGASPQLAAKPSPAAPAKPNFDVFDSLSVESAPLPPAAAPPSANPFGPPNAGPSTGYGAYGQQQQQQPQAYGAYGAQPPPQGYGVYGQPNAPAPYGAGYGAYGAPQPGYGQPAAGYGHPAPGYGQPSGQHPPYGGYGYGAPPAANYGGPAPSGHPQPGYGQTAPPKPSPSPPVAADPFASMTASWGGPSGDRSKSSDRSAPNAPAASANPFDLF